MTTIVCNRSGMAADKRISGVPMFRATKLFRVSGSLIGVCGGMEECLKFIEWRKGAEQKPVLSDAGFCALELNSASEIFYWGSEMIAVPVENDFYAIGTGAQGALCAVAVGASLKDAIKLVSRWDEATGTEIQTMTLKGK